MTILPQILKELNISEASSRVYLFLAEHGMANARTLAERLSVPRPSVYDHLAPLLALGIVVELDKDGKKYFSAASVDELLKLIEERKERIERLAKELKEKRASLIAKSTTFDPKIRFFEGKRGLVEMLGDMLWSGVEEIRCVWPYEEMLRVFGEEPLAEFNRRRIRHKIALKSIWTKTPKGKNHIWKGGDWKVERRYAPHEFTPHMGYSIYGDKVSFISSYDELYGFIVHSRDFAQLKSQEFKTLWTLAKPR